jgi:hypothetical protein
VLGVYSPQGRADPGEYAQIKRGLGWEQSEIETNSPSRVKFGSEVQLNRQAVHFALEGWREAGWRIPSLLLRKLTDFWLSTDQLFSVSQVPPFQQTVRRLGVIAYWSLLFCGALGLVRLYRSNQTLANTLLWYAITSTLLYLPFAMNTRLRASCIEPLLCVLAGFLGQSGFLDEFRLASSRSRQSTGPD